MILERRFDPEETTQTISDYINAEVGNELGLKLCEVGAEYCYDANLADDLPLTLTRVAGPIRFEKHEKKGYLRTITPIQIGFFRQLADVEEPELYLYRAAKILVPLFLRDNYEWPFNMTPLTHGCVEDCMATEIEFNEADDLQDIHIKVESFVLSVEVVTQHAPTPKE